MAQKAPLFTPVLLVGCIIVLVSFGIRASFGVFQIPIAAEFGWLRSEFSMAIAIQNLAWGIGQPVFGALAERIGDRRAIVIGAFVYAAGLVLSSWAVSPEAHQLYEILVGFGIAGTGFGVVLAVVGRASTGHGHGCRLGRADCWSAVGRVDAVFCQLANHVPGVCRDGAGNPAAFADDARARGQPGRTGREHGGDPWTGVS